MTMKTLWQFSRPHTILGSICSVVTLYILATSGHVAQHYILLILTLIASLACNVCIVGLNQIIDVHLDKINKPNLPLAAGTMLMATAHNIVVLCGILAVVVGFVASTYLGWLIVVITAIGYIYSVPPIQLKRHHLPAAISITLVRGLLVNLGMYIHFRYALYGIHWQVALPQYIWPLTAFIAAFSVAIAWFKDLPDTEGDAAYNYKTLAIVYSKKVALWGGSLMVSTAYLYCIYWCYRYDVAVHGYYLLISHIVLLLLFLLNIASVSSNPASIKPFYLRFWVLFFAEYIVYAVWAVYM